jgi:phosphotransferase system  glucose/maltose/N-acetylglucosamine-specific IIC component
LKGEKMKDKIFGVLQRVGRSFMLPIAILPVAGLLLGLGSSFTNETMLKAYGLLGIMGPGTVFNAIFQVMSDAGNIVFTNLPIIFAMGVAIGMAKKEKEVAALAAAIAFFIMHASIGAMITINGGAEKMLEGATTDVVGITSLVVLLLVLVLQHFITNFTKSNCHRYYHSLAEQDLFQLFVH